MSDNLCEPSLVSWLEFERTGKISDYLLCCKENFANDMVNANQNHFQIITAEDLIDANKG
ncbi:MAG: hypothetical protein RSA79_00390 [Oscillospiraceae bacterium]